MRRVLIGVLSVCATAALLLAAQVPRPAPEFVFSLPTGKTINLSSYKGKVVALEFLLTTCPHCKRCSSSMQRVYEELGGRGFQPLGVAINDGAQELIPGYARELRLTFPIGMTDRNKVIDFLQHPVMLTMMMPQLVIIDKKGTIRAQYSGTDPFFENEDQNLRNIVEPLLKQ
ncbi:MAG: TlpA family protein disulfide reductase [Bryobacteraceae bacterium]|nr:TlpA family protein disulfide reductase [Bryobacteraceae bacterium]